MKICNFRPFWQTYNYYYSTPSNQEPSKAVYAIVFVVDLRREKLRQFLQSQGKRIFCQMITKVFFKQPKETIHKGKKQNNLKQPIKNGTSKIETINHAEKSCLEEQKK